MYKFFIDLDGVMADFNGRFKLLTGKWPREVDKKTLWKTVNSDKEFFFLLEPMEDSHLIWNAVKKYKPAILTGLPGNAWGKDQKIAWVKKTLEPEPDVIVVPRREKMNYAGLNHVLIDDHPENISEWRSKGGIGIYHVHVHGTLGQLNKLFEAEKNADD